MINNHLKTRNNYDRLSRWYDLLSGSSERPARLRGLQALDIRSGENVLEIGCGTGESLPVLDACAGSTGHIFGLDLSAGMLSVARNKLQRLSASNIVCIQGDGLHLPFPKESFDAIFMSFTLELLPASEIPVLLRECRRVLCDSGRIGIVSLLQKKKPGRMERLYTWAHRRWTQVIDCRPIPIEDAAGKAGFESHSIREISMWGLTVGILVAVKTDKVK